MCQIFLSVHFYALHTDEQSRFILFDLINLGERIRSHVYFLFLFFIKNVNWTIPIREKCVFALECKLDFLICGGKYYVFVFECQLDYSSRRKNT